MLKTLVSILVFLFIISGILSSFLLIQNLGIKQVQKVDSIITEQNMVVEKILK